MFAIIAVIETVYPILKYALLWWGGYCFHHVKHGNRGMNK